MEQVIASYTEALHLSQGQGDQTVIVHSLRHLGKIYYAMHNYEQAIALQTEALGVIQQTSDREQEARVRWSLALAFHRKGWVKVAMHNRHQAYLLWQLAARPTSEAPFPQSVKNYIQYIGENWSDELIAAEQKFAFLVLPLSYLGFLLQKFYFCLVHSPDRIKWQ